MDIPMNVIPELQHHQTIESNSGVQQKDDDENIIQEDKDIIKPTQKKSIEDMTCTELNEFILSFEEGWGSAIPLYNEKCS